MLICLIGLLNIAVSMRTYQFFGQASTDRLSRDQAQASCVAKGGHLAVIQSAAENAAADATIPNLSPLAPVWIGIKDGVNPDNSPVCYTNWNNPSNTNGCVIMHTNSDRPKWDPWNPCTQAWPYICSFGTLFPQQCNVVAGGDVHFTTLSNQLFTFNGGGDYLYSDNKHISIMTRSVMLPKQDSVTSVFAAIGLKDKTTNKILEIWWNGKGSEDINIETREDGKKNIRLSGKQMKSGIMVYDVSPFLISKFPTQHRFEIQHSRFDNFYLIGYYFGRSTFTVKLPKEWNNVGLSGIGTNGEYKICHKSKTEFCGNPDTTTNKDIHEIGMSWKVSDEETIFEKVMKVQEFETNYHDLKFSLESLTRSKEICGDHQACIYDYLATGCERFANHTRNDFSTQFTYIGDKF